MSGLTSTSEIELIEEIDQTVYDKVTETLTSSSEIELIEEIDQTVDDKVTETLTSSSEIELSEEIAETVDDKVTETLTSSSEIELSEEIAETVDDKVTKKLISLLNTDLSTKLLDLLTQQNNLTTDEIIKTLSPTELKENIVPLHVSNAQPVTSLPVEIPPQVGVTNLQMCNLELETNIDNILPPVIEKQTNNDNGQTKNTAFDMENNVDINSPAIQSIIQSAVNSALETFIKNSNINKLGVTDETIENLPIVVDENNNKIPEIDIFLAKKGVKKESLEGHTQLEQNLTDSLTKLVSDNKVKSVLEIGFNAGHSADTFLKASENITLVSFDIATHPYVDAGKQYIDEKYPGRHTLIKGDSRETVIEYYRNNPEKKFDLIFIDGGHYENIPQSDLANCRVFSHENTIVVMNDVKFKNIESWNVKPNEAWESFVDSNSIDEIRHLEFPPLNGLSYGKYNSLEIFICSLLREDRMPFIEQNQKLFPLIKTFKSVNGYNTKETLEEVGKYKTKYKDLDSAFRTYGTLACWITKYKMLKYQVDNEIPFLCFIEDDLILEKNFYTYVSEALCNFKTNVNMLRMMTWGEGYITSYESAKRILEHLNRDGIIRNIDNQLREHCGYEIALQNPPMRLMVKGNNGDCGKTKNLSEFNIHDWI